MLDTALAAGAGGAARRTCAHAAPLKTRTWLVAGTSRPVVMHVSTHSSPTEGRKRRRASSHLQGGWRVRRWKVGCVCRHSRNSSYSKAHAWSVAAEPLSLTLAAGGAAAQTGLPPAGRWCRCRRGALQHGWAQRRRAEWWYGWVQAAIPERCPYDAKLPEHRVCGATVCLKDQRLQRASNFGSTQASPQRAGCLTDQLLHFRRGAHAPRELGCLIQPGVHCYVEALALQKGRRAGGNI